MTPADIDKLEAAAKAATPGPWCMDNYECKPGDLGADSYGIFELGEDDPALAYVGPWGEAEANATYIALAHPAAILDLIAKLREAEKERDEAYSRGRAEALEDAAKVADAHANDADRKFAGVMKRHQAGHKNLELAAAAGAGMDHSARNIAAAIRAMKGKSDARS